MLTSKPAALLILILAVLAIVMGYESASAAEFLEEFPNTDNWTIYRSQERAGEIIDSDLGRPVPSLRLLPATSLLDLDLPGFSENVISMYLSNPDTSQLSNFTLSFWIYFDDDVGRAIVTFRMQDDRNYYAVVLSDTTDWYSGIWKFSDDKPTPIAQKGPAVFAPRRWYHVRLEVQGQVFSLYEGSALLVTATDATWSAGRALGIGFYNGYDHHIVHVDYLELATPEALRYVRMLVQTSTVLTTQTDTVAETLQTTVTQTLTNVETMRSTTSTTTTEEMKQLVLVSKTIVNTTYVGVLMPVVDWSSTLFFLLAGIAFGAVADVRDRRPTFELVAGAIAILLGIYFVNIGAAGLTSLAALVIGIGIGLAIRKFA